MGQIQQTTNWWYFSQKKDVTFHAITQFAAGDNLYEMSNPIFWEKSEKYFNMLFAEIFTKHQTMLLQCCLFAGTEDYIHSHYMAKTVL